ncbi:MAG: protein kinase [Pseudomonadota bacterium]
MPAADTIITLELGQYRLRAPLAGSSYGLVWRAEAPHGGPDVAIKLINEEQMARAPERQRARWIDCARTEIAFLEALEAWDERHIVRLLDSGEHQGLPVMALELMNVDLARHVASARSGGHAIDFAQSLAWIGQINQALAKVHQYGWRYLDLKPANVLLDLQLRTVKLADFGTSRLLAEGGPHPYAGTANWQAPEQFFPDGELGYRTDARTDYFALGAMFYYLVTGGLPLRFCSDCGQAYRAHRADAAPALRAQHNGAIPPTLRADEAALFVHRVEQQFRQAGDQRWHGGGAAASGASAALTLLCALIAGERAARPRHALEISRLIGAVRASMADEPAHAASVRALPARASSLGGGAAGGASNLVARSGASVGVGARGIFSEARRLPRSAA